MRVMPALFIDHLFPCYDPKIMGVQQRYIFLYGWNIACVLVPSIIHSFRTDENYVTRLKTDET